MHSSKTVRDEGKRAPSLYNSEYPKHGNGNLLRLSLALKTLKNDTEKVFVTNGATSYLTSFDITGALID